MTRQEFWQQEFSKAATEMTDGANPNYTGKNKNFDPVAEAANWANDALEAFDERFPNGC